jgi:hypothetical protein
VKHRGGGIVKNLKIALFKSFESTINKAGSIVETIRLLGEISRDMKTLSVRMTKVQDGVDDIKLYLARQEEIAKQMLEQGDYEVVGEDFEELDIDDDDKKDLN